VAHQNDCALTALFYRVTAHAGMKKAVMAVAHRILILAYYIIRDGSVYREAGGDVYEPPQSRTHGETASSTARAHRL
jgi:hypothetical protein